MADGTKIEWSDATWNIITGCRVVSPGCTNCYAMKLAGSRLLHDPSREGLTQQTKAGPVWNGKVRFNEKWLDQPLRWKRPRRIFVCAHGDLFHENVPDEWIDKIFTIMALCPQHTFQVLTKRPKRMQEYVRGWLFRQDHPESPPGTVKPLHHIWLGVSAEDQERANERVAILLDTPAAVRWISAEPLLGPIDLGRIVIPEPDFPDGSGDYYINALTGEVWDDANGTISGVYEPGAAPKLDWIVAGGESGANARLVQPRWIRALRDACIEADTSFLFKQWGNWAPYDRDTAHSDPRRNPVQGKEPMIFIGKKAAGRLLDGREWNEMPKIAMEQ